LLILQDGSTLLSSQGCQQGDVFASFLFCMVVRAIHLRAKKMQAERQAQGFTVWEQDKWYLDDNLCFGPWEGVTSFFHFLRSEAEHPVFPTNLHP
jgi:hypothetical protein